MSTDTERREVARRLRRAWANVPDRNTVRHHVRVLYEIYAAVGLTDDDDADAIDLFDRLADLIEPEPEKDRTCRMVHDNRYSEMYMGDMLRCISCGAALPERFVGPYNYCPSCGARVIEEES